MRVDIKQLNPSATNNAIQKAMNQVIQIESNLIHDVAEDIVKEAQNNLRLNGSDRTGNLLESIKILEESKQTAVVGTDEEYAKYVEFGRGPVVPRDPKGVLHWVDPDTGEDVFTKYSSPVEPAPFLHPAVESVTAKYKSIVTEKYNG